MSITFEENIFILYILSKYKELFILLTNGAEKRKMIFSLKRCPAQ